MSSERPTTKVCYHCEGTVLVKVRSQRFKVCNACKKRVPWYLDQGQKPDFEATAIDVDYSKSVLSRNKQSTHDEGAPSSDAKSEGDGVDP